MLARLRSTWLAGGGAVLLVLSLTGIAAGAALVADTSAPVVEPVEPAEGATDTTLTFEDVDGDGVDDDCQDVAAVAAPDAVTAALTAADLDGDGTISTSEAAQTDWTGGSNCNHGGYVSGVAQGDDEDGEDAEADEQQTECETPVEPVPAAEVPADTAPNAHGKAVSEVAQSDAVGGKNCNHGGAVSEAAKKDHSATQANAATHGNAAKKAFGKSHGKGNGAQD